MTTLYVQTHPAGLLVCTRLPEAERLVVGDVADLVLPGEQFSGLTFEQLTEIAATTRTIESSELPDPA